MGLKTFLSAVLVASLLGMSSVGSACDLACSLPKLHSCCAPATTAATPASAGMNMSQENPAGDLTVNATSHPEMPFVLDEYGSAELCSPSAVSLAVLGEKPSPLKSVAAPPAVTLAVSLPHLVRHFYPTAETASAKTSLIRSTLFNLRI
jgi:hypothetical protein